jgi:hypothetical protein
MVRVAGFERMNQTKGVAVLGSLLSWGWKVGG